MKYLNRIFAWMGNDDCKHIILSAILTVVAKWLLPVWVAVGVVMAIGIAKEVHDKVSGRGCAEWKDLVCDVVGIVIGVM